MRLVAFLVVGNIWLVAFPQKIQIRGAKASMVELFRRGGGAESVSF